MRIIAGQFKGHTLISPPGGEKVTRPITDRAKQSLFDNLQDCFAAIDPATNTAGTVLDCFAGTGSMGLECLSRGAAHAIFIERDHAALRALKQNLAALNLTPRATILPIDAYALATTPSILTTPNPQPPAPNTQHPKLTIAFVDPPYSHTDTGTHRHKIDDLLRALAAHAMVDGGILSFRHPTRVSIDPAALHVKILRELHYGDMTITWLTKVPVS